MGVTDGANWLAFRRDALDESEVYDVLDNDRRRRAFLCLRERKGEVALDELATAVARLERDSSLSASGRRDSVYNALHQTHLPKLQALDVVDYDEDQKVVRLSTNAPAVDRHLRVRTGLTWGEYYQVLSVTSLLAVLCAELDVWAFGAVDTLALVTVSLAAVAASATYQVWSRRWLYVRSLLGG